MSILKHNFLLAEKNLNNFKLLKENVLKITLNQNCSNLNSKLDSIMFFQNEKLIKSLKVDLLQNLQNESEGFLSSFKTKLKYLNNKKTSFFFQNIELKDKVEEGHLVLGSKKDMIEVLKLDGSKEFNVARDNLFCWTNGVVINRSLKGQGIQNNGLLTYQLSGSGNVALDGFGDFITYEVFPGEKAEVNPKCLIAWESTITPKQKNVIKKVIYHKYSKFQFKFIDEFKKDRLKAAKMVLKNFGVNFFTLNKNLLIFVWEELTINSFFRLKNWSFGQTEMYQVEGPGIIYLSSNI